MINTEVKKFTKEGYCLFGEVLNAVEMAETKAPANQKTQTNQITIPFKSSQ